MSAEERKRIGNKIRIIRLSKGISQEKLAELTGFEKSNISRIELGKYSTGIDILSKIAEALDAKIDII